MKRLFVLTICALAGALAFGSVAQAAPLKWHGTSTSQIGTLPVIVFLSSGISTVNGSTGYGHLNQAFNMTPFSGVVQVPVTDPEVTQANGIVAIKLSITGGGGTISEISGGGPINSNTKTRGVSKICLYDPNCNPGGFIGLNLYEHGTLSTDVGVGIGGLLSVGGFGGIRISVINNPWTLGNAQAVDETDAGNFVNVTTNGFAHGPASLTSSTAKPSGVVQFVTPSQITTNLTVGSASLQSSLSSIRFHFIPEPGMLLLLGSGVAGLILIGRSRMRK
jgi:hypothetical protein